MRFDRLSSSEIATADWIDCVCDEFESLWCRGDEPQIEDFLDQCEPNLRDWLLAELLLVEGDLRAQRGEKSNREEYQKRFPEYTTVIEALDFPTIYDGNRKEGIRSLARIRPGDRLAHFVLLEQLGAGNSGTVWKSRDTRLGRVVAIKIPKQEILSFQERERFVLEGQASAQLKHPNIVAVYEIGEDRGRAFIAAEFIDGLNLREWLLQYRPSLTNTAELAAQLAEAAHHAHEQGVIHRDLKPANVLIDAEGHPHITDFGLAKWLTKNAHLTTEGNVLGTPAYMSPEQARGESSQVDRRSDVYALGAILYEMLTRRPPFEGEMASVVHQVINEEPLRPREVRSTIPRDLETICLKAMEKDPSRRYPTTQEMAVDLRRYLRGEEILARRINILAKSWRWIRRRPAVAAAFALAAVAISATIIAGIFAEQNRELLGLKKVMRGGRAAK
jgi:serine/threonine-protein kinase